jgi:hypothetical protein
MSGTLNRDLRVAGCVGASIQEEEEGGGFRDGNQQGERGSPGPSRKAVP